MSTRTKKVLAGAVSKADAEEAFYEYALAEAKISKINSDMDVKFTKIREQYAEDLAGYSKTKEESFERMCNWAENNRDEFGNKKSLEMAHGVLGFRTGTPKLKLLKGFTWLSVTSLLKLFLPDYIRVEEEPAKDKLLADREDVTVATKLKDCGVFVTQEEAFFAEAKKELNVLN